MKVLTGPESVQGSEEWLQFRKNRIGASMAAAIMGIDPWTTAHQLWRRMLDLDPPIEENDAMKRGKELEPIARDKINEEGGFDFTPVVAVSDKYDYIFASLDGLSSNKELAIEIKCPSSTTIFNIAWDGEILPYYMPQLQHQLYVTGHDQMAYYVYKDGRGKYMLVDRDEEYIAKLIEAEHKFYECLQSFTPPELTDEDYIQRNDKEWNYWSKKYFESRNDRIVAEEQEEEARKKLIELSGGSPSMGGNLKLSKTVRKGAVQYNTIPILQTVNLEDYRAKPIEIWRVTCGKTL